MTYRTLAILAVLLTAAIVGAKLFGITDDAACWLVSLGYVLGALFEKVAPSK